MAALQVFESEFDEVLHQTYLRVVSNEVQAPRYRQGVPVAQRRQIRQAKRQRRNRLLLGVSVLIAIVTLALPGAAFGGTTGAGLPGDLASSSQLASGMTYVVQPGDTLHSIAEQMNPADPRVAQHLLENELGSAVVITGEHVLIP